MNMSRNQHVCNGGFFDMFNALNAQRQEQGKSLIIGFEQDKKNKRHIRFFDKNNRTVWLDDKDYKRINIEMIRMGALKIGYYENRIWKQIATGHYHDLGLKLHVKARMFKDKIQGILQNAFNPKGR